jgi:hypothetical protein
MAAHSIAPANIVTPGDEASQSNSASLPGHWPTTAKAATQNEILNSLFLYGADEVINLRVLYDTGLMTSQFTQNRQNLAEYVAQIDSDSTIKAIFVQLQVIDPPTLKGLPKGKGVKRHHIKRYRWLVVDVDTIRENKSKSNASDDEKENSLAVANGVYSYLRSLGWPPAVFCDSANGWHLVWKIDLDSSDANYKMLTDCLKALGAKFNNSHAEIDETLAEPEQLIKLWCTTVRKGPQSEGRPWRQSCILKMPETIEVVSIERLQLLISA